ncbi:MAG: hypothetical protein GTO02_03565, partial [Candidatus Dadabacteria bacterium]|nr:hypothetical protein [Candidatus Dadabacteria bacterium]
KLIDIAKNSGCDAVQLQFFNAKENVIKKHKLYSLLEDIQFSEEQWELLVKYAKNSDIQVFACTYDLPSLELAVALKVDGIKLN